MRGEEEIPSAQVIVEIGVVAREIMESELRFAYQNLPEGGYYICSIASRTSLRTWFKADESDLVKYLTFSEYETAVESRFEIVNSEVFGIFIPFLWKVPFVARLVQPICEMMFRPFLPSLFHEKIYLMRRRTS